MIRKEESIVYCTGQIWKYRIGAVCGMIGAVLVAGANWYLESKSGAWFVSLIIAGCAVMLAGMAFPMIAVRCPKCGARWQWLAVNKAHGTKGFSWVARLSACPVCGTSAVELNAVTVK